MMFTKRLREGVRRGVITCSIRIWTRPHVKAGGRYRMGDGHVEVDSIDAIELADVTPKLARESGFAGVVDLLKTAKHGAGTNVYLVRFHYVPRRESRSAAPKAGRRATPAKGGRRKPRADQRARVLRILQRLPEAAAVESGTHLSLEVRNKRFGYFLDDHHGDGRIAINCKASPDVRDVLEQLVPIQFHVPKYLGSKGWIGLWLDTAAVDWSAAELALREAYGLIAPKKLRRVLLSAGPRAVHVRAAAPDHSDTVRRP